MAVEANLRKRKHSEHNDEEDVPKKIKKKVNKQHESEFITPATSGNAEAAQDITFEEKPMKFSNDFKMLEFRNKLRGTNFITELRHFLYLMERKPQIVAKYIEKRGRPLELAGVLERVNKANLLHISYVCHALQAVIMEIVSNQPAHMESVISACHYFLKVHSNVVEQLLESPQIKHRRIALKLLTAIVCADPRMGRQILAAFNILSDVRKIQQYLYYSNCEQNDEETVRKCYIHFVLAFLVDGNSVLVQNILDRSALLQALVRGLLHDDQTTVCLVLNTLKKYVLENALISKTKKIHVFDLESCKRLVRLYEWLGTRVYFATFRQKKDKADGGKRPKANIDALVDLGEREIVASTAHEFLLTLLTSRKYGIAFDASLQLRQKCNAIQGKIIGFLQNPWSCVRKRELIIKILKACPDLGRHTVRHFSNVVTLQKLGEKDFPMAADFLTETISILHPNILRHTLKKLTLTDIFFWIKDICLPIETLDMLRKEKMLTHSNVECRLATHRLLLAMFKQYSNFECAAMQREQSKGSGSGLRRFKFDIFSHILTNFPSVDHILQSLNITTSISSIIPSDIVLKHLDITLDLILVICKQNRAFVDRTGTILEYLKLIRPLYAGDEDNEDDADKQGPMIKYHGDINLQLKAIKTILLLHPSALQPNQELFPHVLRSFINGFVYGSDDVQKECGNLLREIFKNTGIFDRSVLEIDIWLVALRFFDSITVNVVTQVFVEVLKVTQAEVELPSDADSETNETNLNSLFENIEKGHCVQTYIEDFALSKLLPLIFKGVEIVDPLDKYLEIVCLLLFHYHTKPAYVAKLYEMKLSALSSYMYSFINTAECETPTLPEVCEEIPLLKELQSALLTDYANISFERIFGSTNEEMLFEMELEGKTYKLLKLLKDERLIMIYIQHVTFIVSRLMAKNQLRRSQVEFAANCITNFLAIANELEHKNNVDSDVNVTDEGVGITTHGFLSKLATYVYDIRFGCLSCVDLCNVQVEQNMHYIHFITLITEYCSKLPDFSIYVKNFRLKIVKALEISMETVKSTGQLSNPEFLKMIEAIQLDVDNCLELMELICKNLKYSDFFMVNNDDTFQRTFFYELLICILRRLTELGQAIQCEHIVKALSKYYVNFIKKLSGELNLEDFEEVFYKFLLLMHQYIPCLDPKIFSSMFAERKRNKSSIKLACLLLERCDKFDENFLYLLPDHIGKRELLYPLLEIAFNKNINIDAALLANIYQEYRSGFIKTIEKPQKAGAIYKEHADCSVKLINSCMPLTECMDFCKKRLQLNDVSEIYQIRLIHAIYEKTLNALPSDATTERAKVFINFLNLQVQMMANDLKRLALTREKLNLFAYQIYNWFIEVEKLPASTEYDFEIVTKSQNWLNFCKSCLKFGMQTTEDIEVATITDEEHGLLLKFMAYICNKLYIDYSTVESIEPNEPAQLFEMICTHSKYYEIVLSPNPTQIKTSILQLLFVLGKKSPTLALPHLEIPVLLGAYHAKLSEADRYALALLQLYEQHNAQELRKYRPFIWGESAISFYALHVSDLNERTRLTQQETTINLVMSLIDYQTCEYTIDNFPIWRKLNAIQQIPNVEFLDTKKLIYYSLGANDLERNIELNWRNSNSAANTLLPTSIDLRLCPKGDDVFPDCYDPAFFIPLMSNCFAPESYLHAARPVENGVLALCFAALSSHDKDMRQAAGAVQLRYRSHFEQSKFFERPLWIQAYENIQAGLAELSNSWKAKHKNHSKEYKPTPRVPYIPTLFIAKTFNITNDPTNLLYKHLTMYLRLKSTFNFQCIPEFNILFHSPEVEHHTFRQFILDIIRKGVKGSSDLFLLVSTNTFKVLLSFYGGAMSTLETNLLILSAFSTFAKIPASAKIMINHVGVLPWLQSIISTLEFHQFDVIEGIISILNNLWYAITAMRSDFYNYNYIALELYHLIVSLLPLLSSRISAMRFAKLMNIMQKTAATIKDSGSISKPYTAISDSQLDKLISCAQKHFGTEVQYLRNLKILGGAGAGSHDAYCAQLYAKSFDQTTLLAMSSLSTFIIDMWESTKELNSIQTSTNLLEKHVEC